jgi:hypothetical protein
MIEHYAKQRDRADLAQSAVIKMEARNKRETNRGRENHVENRLFSPHNTLTKAFTTNVSFLRGFPLRSMKTSARSGRRQSR